MTKNIEKLAQEGERLLMEQLAKDLNKIKKELDNTKYRSEPHPYLAIFIEDYKTKVKNFKENYGVEFPEIQEEYNKMLSEIKKYVEVKEE